MQAVDERPWWQRAVVYQVYPRSFLDASGDGVGDLQGVAQKLDYLSTTLGVDAVWLSPFYRSPMVDFGYDISDHTDVDPLFGTLADFDDLLREAHSRGLRVIVDYVANHTSEQHTWFQEARASRHSSKRDWFVWADPLADGGLPNNWLSIFGGPAWEWDAVAGQFYLHSFLKEQPDLNLRNPTVRQAMGDVLRFWLERGVDGFRMDALHYIGKDPLQRDNPPNPAPRGTYHKPLGVYDEFLHQHDKGHSDLHAWVRDMRQVLDEYSAPGRERLAIGEMHIYDPVELCRYYGAALDELHLPFYFGLLNVPWTAEAVRTAVQAYEDALPPGAWPNYVLGNHDESRIGSRLGRWQARLAMLLLLTLRGTPTVYYGDELGLEDVAVSPEQAQDPWGKNVAGFGLGRDPQRAPMPWDASPTAGFCPPGAKPWLPLPGDLERVSVEAQLRDPDSMLALTRRLLRLRRERPALAVGDYRPLSGAGLPDDCFVYIRELHRDRMLVALNFAEEPRSVRLPPGSQLVLSTRRGRPGPGGQREIVLEAHEGGVLELGS